MITTSFFILLVLAFVMSMEFGQTAAEVVRRGTTYGIKDALLVFFGAAASELLFLALTVTGVILFLSDASLLKFVWLIGGIIVSYLGVQGLLNYKKGFDSSNSSAGGLERRWSFSAGFAVNFLHPLNILWWAGTLGPIILSAVHSDGYVAGVLDGLGVPIGALMWWGILSIVSTHIKHSLPAAYAKTINLISSAGLIGFGIYFLYQAVVLWLIFLK